MIYDTMTIMILIIHGCGFKFIPQLFLTEYTGNA